MPDNAQVTILHVEDDEAARYARSRVLSRAGFRVREAKTGQEALHSIAGEPPDIILIDVKLPDIDGFEVCRRIKSDPRTASIIVLQLSAAYVEKEDKVRGLEGGADGYLTEPMHPEELVSTVRAFVRLQQAEDKVQKANQELARQARELQRSNESLQQFASVASHDLQEPLRMVTSYVQLLASRYHDQLDAAGEEFIGYALEGTTRMRELIEDLLTYSRVESRRRLVTRTNCEEVLGNVLHMLQASVEDAKAQITHDRLPTLLADASQLGQLLQNLLSNALKFHGAQPPHVHISARQHEGQWVFAVRDHGIGIDPRSAERIFVIFQRLHTRKEYPGTGMGLAICKKIVERHGGQIWVESEPGNGATFYFTLPLEGTDAPR